MALVVTDDKHYQNIAHEIREKTDSDKLYPPASMAAGVNDVYEAGKASMIDQSKIIEKTVSGKIISVDDVSEIPHEVSIQLSSDTAFSGATIKVYENLFAGVLESGSFNANTGALIAEPTRARSADFVKVSAGTYIIETPLNNLRFVVYVYDTNQKFISSESYISWSASHQMRFTINGERLIRFGIRYEHNGNIYPSDVDCVILRKEESQPIEIIANSLNTLYSCKSISPNMTVFTDNENVDITMDYHKSYGMQTERDRFMDGYLANVTDGCSFMFAGNCWNDRSFSVVENQKIVVGSSAYGMFWGTGIKDLIALCEQYNVVIDFSQCAYFPYLVREAVLTTFPEIDTRSSTSIANLLYSCIHVHTIKKIILKGDGSQTINSYSFYNLQSLEQITFEGVIGQSVSFQWSTKLSKASIINIFEHLSTTATFTATFSKTAVTNAFGSTTATEWTNLIATKSNWTISLV